MLIVLRSIAAKRLSCMHLLTPQPLPAGLAAGELPNRILHYAPHPRVSRSHVVTGRASRGSDFAHLLEQAAPVRREAVYPTPAHHLAQAVIALPVGEVTPAGKR